MDWWNVLRFGVIPVLTVAIIFILKRKLLWVAPLISVASVFVTYMVSLGLVTDLSAMAEFFGSSEHTWYLFMAMLLHLGIAIILTLIAYLAAYLLKRYQRKA